MRIAIVHYHLRGGGVTRVVSHQLTALEALGYEAVAVVGEWPDGDRFGEKVRVFPELAYDARRSAADCAGAGARLLAVCREALGGVPDVLHIHNHSLGKNAALPTAVRELAAAGRSMVLQLHDFAEDWRPTNFSLLRDRVGDGTVDSLTGSLYPNTANVHYALLNSRDAEFLVRAGVVPNRVHVVPNAVAFEEDEPCDDWEPLTDDHRLFVYPTRAIRRKNIGEFILWSALATDPEDLFGVTLAPQNPVEREFYEPWVDFVGSTGLPVVFELMERARIPFPDVLRRAESVVSTSVTEGFGLAFLEPWLLGTGLLGRNLPEITSEFGEAGVNLGVLYDELTVPVEWCGGEDEVIWRMGAKFADAMLQFGLIIEADDGVERCRGLVSGGRVDFGRLDEGMQRAVIKQLVDDSVAREELRPEWLDSGGDWNAREDVIRENRENVLEYYGLDRYAERLDRVYCDVLEDAGDKDSDVDVRVLLESYLAPERFRMLRS
jgi:glycosyltransferase involved in cell wall biosynthesis